MSAIRCTLNCIGAHSITTTLSSIDFKCCCLFFNYFFLNSSVKMSHIEVVHWKRQKQVKMASTTFVLFECANCGRDLAIQRAMSMWYGGPFSKNEIRKRPSLRWNLIFCRGCQEVVGSRDGLSISFKEFSNNKSCACVLRWPKIPRRSLFFRFLLLFCFSHVCARKWLAMRLHFVPNAAAGKTECWQLNIFGRRVINLIQIKTSSSPDNVAVNVLLTKPIGRNRERC